jgi:acetyl-CoA carboxylase biotin carboxylase subunit
VTELVTGIDLVDWQLRIAAGEHLTIKQADVTWTGSAVECRVYAEDPEQTYMPSPGKILHLREPSGPGIRLDSGIYEGWTVPIEYDPLLAKLCAWAATRDAAAARLDRALAEYTLTGLRTNIAWFREILRDPEFLAGRLSTAFLDDFMQRRQKIESSPEEEAAAALVLALQQSSKSTDTPTVTSSKWAAMREENYR